MVTRSGPQWSPAAKAGNTRTWASTFQAPEPGLNGARPQRPGIHDRVPTHEPRRVASMEPGRKGREYVATLKYAPEEIEPQWSPAAKPGNTRNRCGRPVHGNIASMEPGRKGREYRPPVGVVQARHRASMEPGRKGREYGPPRYAAPRCRFCLNGARPQRPGIQGSSRA